MLHWKPGEQSVGPSLSPAGYVNFDFFIFKMSELRDFPGGPVVRTLCFHYLVGELRSHKPCGMAKINK